MLKGHKQLLIDVITSLLTMLTFFILLKLIFHEVNDRSLVAFAIILELFYSKSKENHDVNIYFTSESLNIEDEQKNEVQENNNTDSQTEK